MTIHKGIRSWFSDPKRLRVSTRDRIVFTKRLGLYLRSGIPIVQAVGLMSDESSGAQRTMLNVLSSDIQRGVPLSQSVSEFPKVFQTFHIHILAVGEASGTLASALAHVSETLQRRAERVRTLLSALLYPFIILLGTLGISAFLVLYAFPKIVPIFKSLHATLPLSTRILIAISNLFQKHGILIAIGLFLLVVALWYVSSIAYVRHHTQRALLRMPLFGALIQTYYLASIFRMLATLLRSGMRIDVSLSLVQEGISHYAYTHSIQTLYETILAGSCLSSGMRMFPKLYPKVCVQIIAAGELTGTLSDSAQALADIYEEQLREKTKVLSSLLEPVLMVSMGTVVGFVALAIITPMYGITQQIQAQSVQTH